MSKSRESEIVSAFSRRQFLKIMSLEVGLLALGGCRNARATQALIEMTQTPIAILPGTTPPVKSTNLPSMAPPVESAEGPTDTPAATSQSQPTAVAELANAPATSPTSTPIMTAEPAFLPGIHDVGWAYSLPRPRLTESMSLMNALANRRSTRTFLPNELPVAILSDLLWAGFGVNRPENGMRTAPSARNIQDIQIYAACSGGLWRYEAQQHNLLAILADDIRELTQPTSGSAIESPVQLIYVSRFPAGVSETEMVPWSWAHTGFVSQNVYLYCAAMGLATVVRYAISRPPLAERMGLQDNEHITLVQSVGWRG